MDPDEIYGHGLNERVPIKAFYGDLDHWRIIIRALPDRETETRSVCDDSD